MAARRRRAETALQQVRKAVAALRRERSRVTVTAVARRAGVSRTFVYDNPRARATVAAALADADQQPRPLRPATGDEQQDAWRERALNAEETLKTAYADIRRQRTRIGELLGRIRDLEAEWDDETIARVTTENTTLKQRTRQLTADNHTLEERLAAARSTLRFQDRRLAELEARIADPAARP